MNPGFPLWRISRARGLAMPVWVGHSCPTLPAQFMRPTFCHGLGVKQGQHQRQGQRRRTRVSDPHTGLPTQALHPHGASLIRGRPRASDSLPASSLSLSAPDFGGCTLTFLPGSLENEERGQTIPLARLGRWCQAVCSHFGLRLP